VVLVALVAKRDFCRWRASAVPVVSVVRAMPVAATVASVVLVVARGS
jgi:hypothetical protein